MLIPDHETKVDYLNGEAVANAVVEILREKSSRPVTIGIHGDWGAGKSSVLRMIEDALATDNDVAVLWFNGWAFEGFDDAKTVLIEATITELRRQRSTIGKVKSLSEKLLRRIDWLKVAKRGSGLAFNVATGLPSPDQIGDALSALKSLASSASAIDPQSLPDRLEKIGGFLKPADGHENLPETIYAFRKEFQELLDEAGVDQLVVLIDDLDRCLPATAIQTLEAIRLFLFVPKTAFVVGADEAMIEYAVRQHFPDLPIATGPLPYARNYLEKLIQVPFRIPSMGAVETRTYVTLLLVESIVGGDHAGFLDLLTKARSVMKKPWLSAGLTQNDVNGVDVAKKKELGAAFVLAQQIAPILAEGTRGNPRQVKRFLNALLLRQVIARACGFADLVSQPILARLMLAERFQPDFYEAIAAQAMTSPEGTSADLLALEEAANAEEPVRKTSGSSKSAKKATGESAVDVWLRREWLKRWLKIRPTIGAADLRPYVFVARDKRLISTEGLPVGLNGLIETLCGSQLEVRSVEPRVKLLNEDDAMTIFSALRERVLSVGSFALQPAGIVGLMIIAKHHPTLQKELVYLLRGLDVGTLGLWVLRGWNESITESVAKSELQAVLQEWADQDSNTFLKQGAVAALTALKRGGT